MQFEPKTACERQYFNKALSEIKDLMERGPWREAMARYQGQYPEWMLAAVKQHALFYAQYKCQGR